MGRWRTEVRPGSSGVTEPDPREALRVCAQNPVASVLAAARLEATLKDGDRRIDSPVWGFERDGVLTAVCWAGANLVPVCNPDDGEALDAFAERALREGRRCSSIVGEAATVLGLWGRLRDEWGPAREVRANQPSLVIDRPPAVEPDPAVRLSRPDELHLLMPACVQMFVEEVGYSPLVGSPGAYQSRVLGLIGDRRSFVRTDPGPDGPEVSFKAELGAVSSAVAQVQGVWVRPDRRGQGLSTRGMAAVVAHTLATVAPVVSLYVNDYNVRALSTYHRVGFRQVGTYATILF